MYGVRTLIYVNVYNHPDLDMECSNKILFSGHLFTCPYSFLLPSASPPAIERCILGGSPRESRREKKEKKKHKKNKKNEKNKEDEDKAVKRKRLV